MTIHHHKPSMALARIRQLRGYRIYWDLQTKKREANENKIEKKRKLQFDSNNNEKKDYLNKCHPQYKLVLIPP